MGDVKTMIPSWTKEDYTSIDNPAPYEWLYEKRNDKFIFMQYRGLIAEAAGAVGVKNFIKRYTEYANAQSVKRGEKLENVTMFDGQPCELLCGEYSCDDSGVTVFDKFGKEITVCDHPIMPVQRLVNIDSGEIKLEIAYKRRGRWVRKIFDKTILSSSQKIVDLAKYGIGVDSENSRELVRFLSAIENLNYDQLEEIQSVGRLGWIHEYGFSPYVDGIKFDGDLSFKNAFEAIQQRGNFAEWLAVAREVRRGGVVARIALAASFASVLVEPIGGLPFFVHLWGGTEAGKTVGLMLAASVWANPALGEYIHTFNATSVGQEMMAGFCNSLPLCIDELQVIKERRDFDGIIYMLTEGIGRSRGQRAGGLQRLQTWKNCILTTGEMPISTSTSGGGAVNRIIDVDCKDDKLFSDPHGVVQTITKHYGHAGRLFIDFLETEGNLDVVRSCQHDIYQKLASGESTEKQAQSASLILTADAIADLAIFRDGITLQIKDIEPFLTSKADVSANDRAYEWLIDFVAINQGKFCNPDSPEVWGAVDGNIAFIIKSVFDDKMSEAGYNPTAFLSWAARNGKIERGHDKLTKTKRIKGFANPVRCVWLVLPVLLEDMKNNTITVFDDEQEEM
jgi:hypothetical protein